MDANIIGGNIRTLRKLHRETQAELAKATYIQKSHISEFEKGKKIPSGDNLELIAKHYRVTVESLSTKDFFGNDEDVFVDISNTEILQKDAIAYGLKAMLIFKPIDCDKSFEIAQEKHKRLFFSDVASPFDEVRIALHMYKKSWEETHNYKSAANAISLMLLTCNMIEAEDIASRDATFKELKKVNIETLLKSRLLKANEKSTAWEKKRAFAEEQKIDFYRYLKALRSDEKTYALADYYDCIRYIYGLVTSDISEITALSMGFEEMFFQYENMKNKYAKDFLINYSVVFLGVDRTDAEDIYKWDDEVPA